MLSSVSDILANAKKHSDDLSRTRGLLHSRPELAYEEIQTSSFIASSLEALGLEVSTNIGGTGVVAVLPAGSGRGISFRAEMDALPIQEETGLSCASQVPGKMHACGHDVHMAILLGTAHLLVEMQEHLSCPIHFIFQPSEETEPSGARGMIEADSLRDIDAIYALHVDPRIQVGYIGIRDGAMNASADAFAIEVKGKGGHAAHPHRSIDAIPIASSVVTELQKVVSRRVDPLQQVVVTIGTIEGGLAENIIADSVRMRGTIRTLDPDVRQLVPSLMEAIIDGVTRAHGGTYSFEVRSGEPVLVNDSELVRLVRNTLRSEFGDQSIIDIAQPVMGADDFAFYLQHVPGVMLRLGIANEDPDTQHPLHHPKFTIDERALPIGVATLATIALKLQGAHHSH